MRNSSISLDIRALVDHLEKLNALKRPTRTYKLEFEVAAAIRKVQPTAIVMNTEKGLVVSNVLAKRSVFYEVLGAADDREAYQLLLSAMNSPRRLDPADPAGLRSLGDDLLKLPVPKLYEKDGGHYITAGVFLSRDPERQVFNASIHRSMILDERHLAVRLVPRQLYHMFIKAEKMNKPLPAAIVIGAPPVVYAAAAASPRYGVYEVEVANSLASGRLKASYELAEGIPVPIPSEYVILGEFLPHRRASEGPFVDILGTYDEIRQEPVFEVQEILSRQSPLFYSILPSGLEHLLLMGFPREAAIWEATSRVVPTVRKVRLTPGGGSWLVAVISMAKENEGDPKNVLLAAFAAHPSLKIAIVVDEDIDPDNYQEIEWALATRMQPSEDLLVLSGIRGSSLDPSADQHTLLTSKLGIDATRPLSKEATLFERAKIPLDVEID